MIRRLLVLLFAASLLRAAAPTDATSMVAEHSTTDLATGETVLTGHPRVDYGDLRLTADEIRLNATTRTATAIGHATLTRGPRRLLADKIVYRATDRSFEVGSLRTGEFPVYLSGSRATGNQDSLTIYDAQVSSPEPGDLIPTLHAARLFFATDHKVRTEKADLGVGVARPVPLGRFEHDVREPLLSYATVSGGYRRSLGVFAEVGVHLPVAPGINLGGDLGLYTSRGVMFGPSGSYTAPGSEPAWRGLFRSGFISDSGTRDFDILGRAVPRARGFIEWRHDQQLADHLSFVADLNYWRDSEILRDFRPNQFFRVQQPDTFLESVYSGDNFLVSLFARFQPNTFQFVQQRLPELRFDLLPLAVGAGFVERFSASAAVLRDEPPPTAPLNPAPYAIRRSTRLDAYYGLSRPIRPTEWLAFTPVAGGRLTHYSSLAGAAVDRDTYTRALGELGFDAELHASGTWDYKNPRWKIDGLRHLLTPRLSYRYIPEADRGRRYLPAIDREVPLSTYLAPLGLGDVRNLDDLHATNTLRLGLDNTLQTRDPDYGSRDLLVFNVASDLRFRREPGEKDFSELHAELAVMPARWLELGVYQSVAPQSFTLREFNTGITLRDGDEWSLRFASNFRRDVLEDYYLAGSVRLNEAYELVAHLRYDQRASRFDEQAYGIRQNVANTWRIEYLVTLYDGPRRESRFGFNLRLDAIRF